MKFHFSGTLLRFTDYRQDLEIDAPTVGAALKALVVASPALQPVLYDGKGRIRTAHRLFVNGDPITEADADKPLAATDTLDIITAIAGG
jgi:molybdopterin converting factor small subunit